MTKYKSEEKPYLQDLFEHMNNEHGLILTQSEMLEILSICGKEYDNVQFELGEIERQHTDLSTGNAKLREALRRLEEDTRFLPKSYRNMMNGSISKAKGLLTDKE